MAGLVAKVVATHRPGQGLPLVGGFRFRLLNDSPRMSADVDYHWEGDLEEKRTEIAGLLKREFLPRAEEDFGYVGRAVPARGPGDESPLVKVVTVFLHRPDLKGSRIEIPVDITRIERLDEPVVVTKEGTVYLTLSDMDMIEAKVLAVYNRTFPEIRDVVDLFLFHDYLGEDSEERIRRKMETMSLDSSLALASVEKLADASRRHMAALEEILDAQVDEHAADRIREGGGAAMVFDRGMETLRKMLGRTAGGAG